MFVGKNVWVGSLVVIWVWMCCWIRSNIRNIILDNTHSKPDKHATKVSISDDKQEIVSEEEDSKCCERRSKRIFYHPEKWDYLSKTLTKYLVSPQQHHILWMQIPAKFWWTTSSQESSNIDVRGSVRVRRGLQDRSDHDGMLQVDSLISVSNLSKYAENVTNQHISSRQFLIVFISATYLRCNTLTTPDAAAK